MKPVLVIMVFDVECFSYKFGIRGHVELCGTVLTTLIRGNAHYINILAIIYLFKVNNRNLLGKSVKYVQS